MLKYQINSKQDLMIHLYFQEIHKVVTDRFMDPSLLLTMLPF